MASSKMEMPLRSEFARGFGHQIASGGAALRINRADAGDHGVAHAHDVDAGYARAMSEWTVRGRENVFFH